VGVGWIEERFLHYASRRVRRSEREEKASARCGRNDKFQYIKMKIDLGDEEFNPQKERWDGG
jgi:hypothetical protein